MPEEGVAIFGNWAVGYFEKKDSAGAPNPTREGACAPRKRGK